MPKPDTLSWEAITQLLHEGFRTRAEQGLNYLACTQSVETTKERVGDGLCLVAMLNDRLVGTATLHIENKKGKAYGHLSQITVSPECRGLGIARKLEDERERICREAKVECIYVDTSEKATDVINWKIRRGWQLIRLFSHNFTNYYSVGFRLPICGRRYSKIEARTRFFISSCFCKSLWREDGSLRPLGKVLRKIKRLCKR